MKNVIKKLLGIDRIEAATAEAELRLKQSLERATEEIRLLERSKIEAERSLAEAQEQQRLANLSAKELATVKNLPYIEVMDIKVNSDNIRNGFFELDWNSAFVLQLVEAGYTGVSEEEIVERWFQDTCRNIGAEAGVDLERRSAGLVNFNRSNDGTTEAY